MLGYWLLSSIRLNWVGSKPVSTVLFRNGSDGRNLFFFCFPVTPSTARWKRKGRKRKRTDDDGMRRWKWWLGDTRSRVIRSFGIGVRAHFWNHGVFFPFVVAAVAPSSSSSGVPAVSSSIRQNGSTHTKKKESANENNRIEIKSSQNEASIHTRSSYLFISGTDFFFTFVFL